MRRKDLRHAKATPKNNENMDAAEFESRVTDWARRQSDVEALIQIGSRVQTGADVDIWSDWDYQLIVHDIARYQNKDWLALIAPCWGAHIERTERGVLKLSAFFAGGWEVDFVLLAAWQMKLVYWAMARPVWRPVLPRPLVEGIHNTRLVVGPGYRVLIGGPRWDKRLTALKVDWHKPAPSNDEFDEIVSGFWRHAVWVDKKIMRGETRAALRWYYREVAERRVVLLAEEARLAGRASRPEARKAEQWLDVRRLEQTAISASPDRRQLAQALLAEISLFEEVSRSVAQSRGFGLPDYAPVAAWIRAELSRLA